MIEGRHMSGILKPFAPGFVRSIAEAEDATDEPSSDPLPEGPGDSIGGSVSGSEKVRWSTGDSPLIYIY